MSNSVKTAAIPGSDDDAALAAAAQQGDLSAFESLVMRHQRRLFNIACRITGSSDDAADAVQDAFLAAFRHLRSFRAESRFSTWLISIAINHARNRLKQARTRRSREAWSLNEPVRAEDGDLTPDPPSPDPSTLDRLEQRDRQQAVQDCIGKLETGFREVIVLRDLQDLSYGEIGAALGVREGTVKSRLFRARESVKECLKRALGSL